MNYLKIKFHNDYPFPEGYMEIDYSIGQCVRLTDLDGNTIPINGLDCGYEIIDNNPPFPSWGTP